MLRRAGGRAREGEGIARPPTRSRLIANPRGLLVLRHGTLHRLDVALLTSAEREKIWATDDRAEGFASGRRGLVIIQGYAREHALLDIVRERLEREGLKRQCLQGGAKCRRHR